MQQSRKNKIIETSVLFQGLSNSGLGGILERCRETEFSPNEYLFKAGQPVSRVYLVLDGVIQLYRGADNGKHAVLGIRERGDVLGVTSALSDSAHYSTAKSVGRSKALTIPLEVFGELVGLDPALPQRLLRHVAGNLHDISEHMERLQLLHATSQGQRHHVENEIEYPIGERVLPGWIKLFTRDDLRAVQQEHIVGFLSRHIDAIDRCGLLRASSS